MTSTAPLSIEQLEDRAIPAVFGTPWPDAQHLTISFAPSSTDIVGANDQLSNFLWGSSGAAARYQILRAFQTWAANSNVNFGLVADNGDPFNSPGLIQGDPRFGDVRVGARTLAPDVLAVTAPFNYFNTGSGNVVINTGVNWGPGGYDLYTALMQESGHTLGIDNSPDLNSVMYEYYQGPRTGLSAGDVENLQSLYGTRQPDAYEGTTGNDTLATATPYTGPLTADLTTNSDVDCYRLAVPTGATNVSINLHAAGLSLVLARVDLLDANGNVLGSASANDVYNNDVALNVDQLDPNATYFVRVSSNSGDAFGVGSYGLSAVWGNTTGIASATNNGPGIVVLGNSPGQLNSFENAAVLQQKVFTVDPRIDYSVQPVLSSASDADYFRIHAPQAGTAKPVNLVVSAHGMANFNALQVAAFDANHQPLAAQVLTTTNDAMVIQIDNVTPDADYYIRVSGDANNGSYTLAADFTTANISYTQSLAGVVTASNSGSTTLKVAQSDIYQIELTAGAGTDVAVQLRIVDNTGQIAYELSVSAGSSQSACIFLAAGTYTLQVSYVRTGSAPSGSVGFGLELCEISDPIGAPLIDPTSSPTGGSGNGGSGTSSGSGGAVVGIPPVGGVGF